MSDEVFLTELTPNGDALAGRAAPGRISLVGVFSSLNEAERQLLRAYFAVDFWNAAEVTWVDRPKGRYLITGDGRYSFGRIRGIELNGAVDGILAFW